MRRRRRSAAVLDRAARALSHRRRQAAHGAAHPPLQGRADYPVRRGGQAPPLGASFQVAPQVERICRIFARDLNVVLARGVRRMFAVALAQYRTALDERRCSISPTCCSARSTLLRPDGRVLAEPLPARVALPPRARRRVPGHEPRAVGARVAARSILGRRARARHQPVDLHRRRSEAVDLPVPRRRSRRAAGGGRYIEGCGRAASPRRSITRSFRAVPGAARVRQRSVRRDRAAGARAPTTSRTTRTDRFPVDAATGSAAAPVLGLASRTTPSAARPPSPHEIARHPARGDGPRQADGVPRAGAAGRHRASSSARARAIASSRQALEARGIPTYVYKGLGFFDADEIKDLSALIRYLAEPVSDLRAAAFLRSRFVRLSDAALARLAPRLAAALTDAGASGRARALDDDDRRVLEHVRAHVRRLARAGRSRCRRPISSSSCCRRPRTPTSCAGRGGSRPGKTSRRCAG